MPQNGRIVGLDIAKGKADACIRSLGMSLSQPCTGEGQAAMVAWLQANGVSTAVMEATAGYERAWSEALGEAGIGVRIVDPKRVKHFAKSAGRLAKNDAMDAELIAWFAETFSQAPSQPRDAEREELAALVTAREALKGAKTAIDNHGEHRQPRAAERAFAAVVRVIEDQISKLERAIAANIDATERFAADAAIIDSTPGLAAHATAGLIAWLPELGRVDNKVAAALIGAAPYDDDSGKRHGERHIKGGRQNLRSLFYMAVVGAATRHNPVLKAYYQRLRAKGKPGKVAIIACMRKLIVILNTMLARRETWDPNRCRLAV